MLGQYQIKKNSKKLSAELNLVSFASETSEMGALGGRNFDTDREIGRECCRQRTGSQNGRGREFFV